MLSTERELCSESAFRPAEIPWRVLCVRPQHELVVAAAVKAKGFEQYLPTYASQRHWHDRRKTIELPLFKGYVFCRFDTSDRAEILRTVGVNSVLAFNGSLAQVSDEEMCRVKRIVASGLPAEAAPLCVGQEVEIICGWLVGIRGRVRKLKGRFQVVIAGPSVMNGAVGVTLSKDWVRAVRTK